MLLKGLMSYVHCCATFKAIFDSAACSAVTGCCQTEPDMTRLFLPGLVDLHLHAWEECLGFPNLRGGFKQQTCKSLFEWNCTVCVSTNPSTEETQPLAGHRTENYILCTMQFDGTWDDLYNQVRIKDVFN